MAVADAPLLLQPVGGGLAAPDPRAPSLPGRPAAPPAAGKPGRRERTALRLRRRLNDLIDEGQRAPGSGAPAVASGTEVGSLAAVHVARVEPTPPSGTAKPHCRRTIAQKDKGLARLPPPALRNRSKNQRADRGLGETAVSFNLALSGCSAVPALDRVNLRLARSGQRSTLASA
jgi:hypothetical protein